MDRISTETVDDRFVDLDRWPSVTAVQAMLEGQMMAIASLQSCVTTIAVAADAAAERLRDGRGRLIYAGAGTSGRVAIQDGVELNPTYNWPAERLLFLMAGGRAALLESAEGAEDDAAVATREVADATVGPSDVVVAVAASGRTPYTVAVLEAARASGALTIGIQNNAGARLGEAAEIAICAVTGPEIVAGSTRMKAGTAQKAALNLLSTTIMIRLGLVHRGMMVNMRVSNEKLLGRARAMVADIADVDLATATRALERSGNDISRATLIARGYEPDAAAALLRAHDDSLSAALADEGPRDG